MFRNGGDVESGERVTFLGFGQKFTKKSDPRLDGVIHRYSRIRVRLAPPRATDKVIDYTSTATVVYSSSIIYSSTWRATTEPFVLAGFFFFVVTFEKKLSAG